MRISGFDDPDSSGWDALHRGTEREGFDSPSKFDMSTLSMIMPKRKPARPQPDPQGYTDEDTREWGSSSDDDDYEAPSPDFTGDDDDEPTGRRARRSASRSREYVADEPARPEPRALPGRRSAEYTGGGYDRRESTGYQGEYAPETGDEPARPAFGGYQGRRRLPEPGGDDHARPDPVGYQGPRSPEFGDDHGRPDPLGYQGERSAEFGSVDYGRPESAGYQGRSPESGGDDHGRPDPFGYQSTHSPVVAEDGYDPVEPEWQDGDRFEPEPPPLEPAWTPPRGARSPAPPRPPVHPPAPRPPAPRPPAPRPPAPVARPAHPAAPPAPVSRQAAPPPAWTPPPPADWTPPPDPETRWIPHPEPWEDPAWNEPARVASPVPVASPGSRVRPYTRTGGRTRSDHNLALEALVSTSDDGRRYRGVRSVEHRRICDLCLDTRSVAEIAAHLRLPLGVVKVLVGDMADIGLVLIHQTELILGDRSSREFMERVLAGLRAL
ncbi:hypothetical protein AMES_8396 [Amycolatopsis mediterranei S699]|uniref:Multi-component regulatory system-8 n=3 Tax=Amycolatopsis mediterranei TaxID=33910 RepID=A0A0H3DJ43_AMYMU|nr:conserved hypothetical protein [Amycolatopsis mediterranei U32]AEK47220.1 hypothetical protein RAM_43765 [Amycolatopsis mediterranei S699]AGT89058.1 hypothetical protein B737_8397 [Amycolatopsis mediterranei RB]KDO07529.1 hypothetical protein DV26_24885 [Amycolatopsis mediterranei]AFO81929.1 hypothetical protein AMES_8396 [Amycolatopsis mediterranei S699]